MTPRAKSKTPTLDAVMVHVAALGGSVRSRAEVLGINYVRLHRLEAGDVPDALLMLDQIADALGLVITVTKDPARGLPA